MMRTELTELGLEVQNLQKVYKGYDRNEPVVALKNLKLTSKKRILLWAFRTEWRGQVNSDKYLSWSSN